MATSKNYVFLTVGGALGLAAAFLQTIEKIILIENKTAALPCDLTDVFSCSAVLSAPQSSLFGFPNSLICMVVFTFFLTIGVIGLTGGEIPNKLRRFTHGLALFMLAFALWFLFTSTFTIGALCIFCFICFAGLLFINNATLRLAPYRFKFESYSPLVWATLALALLAAILVRFYL